MRALLETWKAEFRSMKLWRLAVLWGVCLLYVLYQGGKTSFMLFVMVNLLACYWLLSGIGGIRRVKVVRTMYSDKEFMVLQAGDQAQITLRLQLPRFMPVPYIVVREELRRHNGELWAYEDSVVSRQGEAVLAYVTPALERGTYQFGGTECISEDIFGFIRYKKTIHTGGQLTVLPRTVFIPYWQLYSRSSRLAGPETAVTNSRRETTQINGVRDYVYGDRVSRIHWNATAKTGTWKSKEFEHESLSKTVLVLDAHSSSYATSQQFELAVSVAASVLEYGARARISMGLCTFGKTTQRYMPAEGYIERQEMLHHLVDIQANGDGNYIDQFEGMRDYFPQGAFFILISPLSGERALSLLKWAKSHRMIPYQIHIGDSSSKENRHHLLVGLEQEAISGVHIVSLQELPAVLGGVR